MFCGGCKQEKPLSEWGKRKGRGTGYQTQCKSCMYIRTRDYIKKHPERYKKYLVKAAEKTRARYASDPAYRERRKKQSADHMANMTPGQRKMVRRHQYLTATYRLTHDEFLAMLEKQGGKCAICARTPKRFVIDHDHKTGKVRGLLCHTCNNAIGSLGDDVDGLMRAVRYLSP